MAAEERARPFLFPSSEWQWISPAYSIMRKLSWPFERSTSLFYIGSLPCFWRCRVLDLEGLQEDPPFPPPTYLVISSDLVLWQPVSPGSYPCSLPKIKPVLLIGLDPVILKEPHTSPLPPWISSDFWRTGATALSVSRWSPSYGLLTRFSNPLAGRCKQSAREGYRSHSALAQQHLGWAPLLGDLISLRLTPFYPRAQDKQDWIQFKV